MPERTFYAHSFEGRPPSDWHKLEDHLRDVSRRARCFGETIGSGNWAALAGLWHDLGKYRPDFQQRLHGNPKAVDHAIVGAFLAQSKTKNLELSIPLAMIIAGHHGGLPDLLSLKNRLARNSCDRVFEEVLELLPDEFRNVDMPRLPTRLALPNNIDRKSQEASRRTMEFWIRFLFSALVDADWLDTEAFREPQKSVSRKHIFSGIPELCRRVNLHLDEVSAKSEPTQ